MNAQNAIQAVEYFDQNYPYRRFIASDQPSKVVEDALSFMRERLTAAGPAQYQRDHKGTPLYNLGFSAFACHDYTSASLYFDAAAEADLRYHGGSLDTPALNFMRIVQTPAEPLLATDIIAQIELQTEDLLNEYHARQGHHSINLAQLRSRFFERILRQGPAHNRTLLTAFISFVAEWRYRVDQFELVHEGTREPFFMHLLRGCVLFESLLKNAPNAPPATTLGDALHRNRVALGWVGDIRTSATQFSQIIGALRANTDIFASINCCAQTRNTIGHNLVWTTVNLDAQAYDRLVRNIGVSCIHAISRLFP